MSKPSAWNIAIIRKIAGLNPITESVSDFDDDDEDPDVKIAMKDKRQAAFERRNKNELSSAAKEADAKDKESAEQTKQVDHQPAKPVTKEPDASAANNDKPVSNQRGRKPDDNKKAGQARAWLAANPGAKRGEFMAKAEEWGMGKNYANKEFYGNKHKQAAANKDITEVYFLSHPSMPSFLLAENREMNQMQWIDPSSPLPPLVFESKVEAERIVKYMSEWKSQYVNIETFSLVD